MAIEFKIFDINSKTTEKQITEIFTQQGGDVAKENIFVFADKIGFLMNTDDEETKAKKIAINSFKRESRRLRVEVTQADKKIFMAERRAQQGKNPQDVVEAKAEKRDLLAELDYNTEQIEKLTQSLDAAKA